MEKLPQIVYNGIQTPDGSIICSNYRHDFVSHIDATNGEEYAVDGGTDYLRRMGKSGTYEEMSLYAHDPHSEIRNYFEWGTRGKDGTEPVRQVILKEMDTDHIEAILDTQDQIPEWVRTIFENEQVCREYEKTNFIDPTQMTRNQVEFLLKDYCACAKVFCDYDDAEYDEEGNIEQEAVWEYWGYSSTQGFHEFGEAFMKEDEHREYKAKYIVAMSWLLRSQHDMTWYASHKLAEAYVISHPIEEYDDDDFPLNPASMKEVDEIRHLRKTDVINEMMDEPTTPHEEVVKEVLGE